MTLIEILISLAVVLIGMAGVFKALSTSTLGSSSAQRFNQAQARAQAVIEAIRASPTGPQPLFAPNTLNCLATTQATNWANCEAMCRNEFVLAGNPLPSPQACVFTSFDSSGPVYVAGTGAAQDRSRQRYALVFDQVDATRSSFVQRIGVNAPQRVFDIQISIGWNDDGTATWNTTPPIGLGGHRVTLRQAIFQ